MNCTTAVFTLMLGSILLALATLYFHNRNILGDLKQKMSNLNGALISLQGERSELINKSNDMYVETATKSIMVEKLNEELASIREAKGDIMEKLNVEMMSERDSKKQIIESLNQELSTIKESKNTLIEKLNTELASIKESKNLAIERMDEELNSMRAIIKRLQNDNQLLIEAYQNIEKTGREL
jgi:vacuolar-type H+-ATPase subunit I/STV1